MKLSLQWAVLVYSGYISRNGVLADPGQRLSKPRDFARRDILASDQCEPNKPTQKTTVLKIVQSDVFTAITMHRSIVSGLKRSRFDGGQAVSGERAPANHEIGKSVTSSHIRYTGLLMTLA
jgi:hypothetical protein